MNSTETTLKKIMNRDIARIIAEYSDEIKLQAIENKALMLGELEYWYYMSGMSYYRILDDMRIFREMIEFKERIKYNLTH